MRASRIKEDGAGYYHVVSRVVDRRMVLDRDEKERFRTILRAMEGFSGCEVLTYAIMGNHIHALLYVPDRKEVTDEEFATRLACLYDRQVVKTLIGYLHDCRKEGHDLAAEKLKTEYTYRMYDLSEFMKTVKQRFTQSYNRRHGRKGTLWEERFKSLLVGGNEGALSAVAAYIDLNAVRAGIVTDPKDYRFSGYGEAIGGSAVARRGLGKVMVSLNQTGDWRETVKAYRKLLYVTGEAQGGRTRHGVARSAKMETGRPTKPGFRPEQVEEVLKANGNLPLNELLRCRVRYFTDGAVLGGRAYVEDAFHRHRRHFSPKRLSGARKMLGGGWGDLYTMRCLRVNVIAPPILST